MSRRRAAVTDWAIAVGIAGALLTGGLSGRPATDLGPPGFVLLVAAGLALAALRRAPVGLHIARELHDSLTHQISVIKVQAEAAVHVARKRGEEVPESLLAIREAGREATRELRATLEALRDDGTTPPQGVGHVPELVERARASGLDATLTIEGARQDVPAAVDRTAYRIVQESLTNIARHAAAATASIRIHYRPDGLAIQVDDD